MRQHVLWWGIGERRDEPKHSLHSLRKESLSVSLTDTHTHGCEEMFITMKSEITEYWDILRMLELVDPMWPLKRFFQHMEHVW